ncbi:hypothetical protein [Altererythrobacter aquiaggeris]|uniref:hypothetical protein n=1 Tax=Aestuarierythrobacter aquiaggeris TaxID=1898396 RepID=UPI0030164E71
MNQTPPPDLAAQIAGAIDWWRGAGVDMDYSDQPANWLLDEKDDSAAATQTVTSEAADTPAGNGAVAKVAIPQIGGDAASWPTRLAEFGGWWLSEKTLDDNGTCPRVPPRGVHGAELMIVVAEPEIDDRGTLLGGPHGVLIGNMAAAMGYDESAIYLASALPRHTPLADWAQIEARGMGRILRHHIGLVAPKRLCIFGSGILPLLGHDKAQSPASLQEIAQESGNIPAMASRDIAMLLQSAVARSRFWADWLDWTSN